jgi:oligoribonuclease (3'-5' exoribonuclease)
MVWIDLEMTGAMNAESVTAAPIKTKAASPNVAIRVAMTVP